MTLDSGCALWAGREKPEEVLDRLDLKLVGDWESKGSPYASLSQEVLVFSGIGRDPSERDLAVSLVVWSTRPDPVPMLACFQQGTNWKPVEQEAMRLARQSRPVGEVWMLRSLVALAAATLFYFVLWTFDPRQRAV